MTRKAGYYWVSFTWSPEDRVVAQWLEEGYWLIPGNEVEAYDSEFTYINEKMLQDEVDNPTDANS